MAAVILEALGLARAFGGLRAVDGVDFALRAGEIHALIGPNGAGKTTFVSLLSGRIAPYAGAIRLDGADITRLPEPYQGNAGKIYDFCAAIVDAVSLYNALTRATEAARSHRPAANGWQRVTAPLVEHLIANVNAHLPQVRILLRVVTTAHT